MTIRMLPAVAMMVALTGCSSAPTMNYQAYPASASQARQACRSAAAREHRVGAMDDATAMARCMNNAGYAAPSN